MYAYGQRSGDYNVFHPETFEKPGMYLIRHGTNERVFGSPRISSKKQYIETMNSLGRKLGRKSKKVSSSNKKKSASICALRSERDCVLRAAHLTNLRGPLWDWGLKSVQLSNAFAIECKTDRALAPEQRWWDSVMNAR